MKNVGIVERIVPGTDSFDIGYAVHIKRYEFAKDNINSHQIKGKVLDVGCGTGYGTAYLSDYFHGEVIGIDINNSAIDFAKKYFESSRVNFKTMDAQNLKFVPKSFNAIIALEVIEHVDDPEKMLKDIKKILTKKGLLIISTPNKKISSPGLKKLKNPYHKKEFTQEEFEKILERYFSEVTIFGQYYNNSYFERKKMLDLLNKLVVEKNSVYLNFLRKFIPKAIRKIIPYLMRISVGERIYLAGKNKFRNDNLLFEKVKFPSSSNDVEIDRFYLNKSEVLIAVCT